MMIISTLFTILFHIISIIFYIQCSAIMMLAIFSQILNLDTP